MLLTARWSSIGRESRSLCGSGPYRILWEERQLVSVANLTRADAREFLAIAPRAGIKMQVIRYPLAQANAALADLRAGRFEGAAVLIP